MPALQKEYGRYEQTLSRIGCATGARDAAGGFGMSEKHGAVQGLRRAKRGKVSFYVSQMRQMRELQYAGVGICRRGWQRHTARDGVALGVSFRNVIGLGFGAAGRGDEVGGRRCERMFVHGVVCTVLMCLLLVMAWIGSPDVWF